MSKKGNQRSRPKSSKKLFKLVSNLFVFSIILLGGVLYLTLKLAEEAKNVIVRFGLIKPSVELPDEPEMSLDEMYPGKSDAEIYDAIWEKWINDEDMTSDEDSYLLGVTLAREQNAEEAILRGTEDKK